MPACFCYDGKFAKIKLFQSYFSQQLKMDASALASNFNLLNFLPVSFKDFLNFSWKSSFGLNLQVTVLSTNLTKWSSTLKQFVGSSVFDHFVGLALKRVRIWKIILN